ncbi:unnamed protein product [Eretmochelys imbricata]
MLRSSHSLWQGWESLDEGSLGLQQALHKQVARMQQGTHHTTRCEPGPHYISLAWRYPYWSCALEMTENIGVPFTSFRSWKER